MNSLNFIKKMKIGPKLILYFLIIGIIPLTVVGVLAYIQASNALSERAINQLVAIRDIKTAQITDYFQMIKDQVITLSNDEMTIAAMLAFDEGLEGLGGEDESAGSSVARRLYINENPHPAGEKLKLDAANDKSAYTQAHRRYHHLFRDYLERFEYYDIFLVDPHKGAIVYTVYKEDDYATSLVDGQYAGENIAEVYKEVRRSTDPADFAFVDFEPYAPSNGVPASFVASPIIDSSGDNVGVLIFQMPIGRINAIMGLRSGMGETGESYLVGSDKLMRSDSFLDPVNHTVAASFANPNLGSVDTEAARNALAGKVDAHEIIDYNGNPVLSAYTPIELFGTRWALLSEIDVAEAFATVYALRTTLVIIALVIAAVIVAFAIGIAKTFTNPIHLLMTGMAALGKGDLTAKVSVDTNDEIGTMAESFNESSSKLLDAMTKILTSSSQVENAATQISSASEQLAAGAEEQQAQLSEVATTMEQMSAMILEASKNADETRESAQHTGRTADEGREVVSKTVTGFRTVADTVEHAAQQIQELNKRSEEIGSVIQVIDDIADQTNLLALNANIEAARAGDAGRGFAVVADEVRKLAERTVSATAEISKMIESIQGDIKAAVVSMEQIQGQSKEGLELVAQSDKSLEEIAGSIINVVSAVEQIATSTNEQSSGAEEISKNIEGVTTVAKESASSAQELAASAEQLNNEVQGLNELIGQFKVK